MALALTLLGCAHSTARIVTTGATNGPQDAIGTIVDAFKTHPIVALNDEHGDERCSAFRLALIRDSRFAESVDDIVVEFGNSRYQTVIDAFVSGATVPEQALKAVWQNTTQPHAIWDRPIYEEFFRAVRDINAALPGKRRLRVLLGDPPIDWDGVRTIDDFRVAASGRGIFPADVIAREVLTRERRALVIYGGLHLMRQNLQGPNLIERVETASPGSTFVVIAHPLANLGALGIDPSSWPAPSIALTKRRSVANQLDAILYLGQGSGRASQLSPALCADSAYQDMRRQRMRLAGNIYALEQFNDECASRK